MAGNFMDDINSGDFFDHIDDLLDFSSEEIDANLLKENCDSFPTTWPTESDDSLTGSGSVFSGTAVADLSAALAVPYEDIIQLEWLSNFVEDSFSGEDLTMKKDKSTNITKEPLHHHYRTSSPDSVLESSSSCSEGDKASANAPQSPENSNPNHPGRARSKRPRPATFNPRPAICLTSSDSPKSGSLQPLLVPKTSSDSENFAESHCLVKKQKQASVEHKKKKSIKVSFSLSSVENKQVGNHRQISSAQPVKKCTHCEITETPQWRAGPMGPKTLCNACGVRYKSGRLFPEYRPAASPTFVPSLHSNSHRKVLEMRSKSMARVASITKAAENAPELPVLIPNNCFSPDYN